MDAVTPNVSKNCVQPDPVAARANDKGNATAAIKQGGASCGSTGVNWTYVTDGATPAMAATARPNSALKFRPEVLVRIVAASARINGAAEKLLHATDENKEKASCALNTLISNEFDSILRGNYSDANVRKVGLALVDSITVNNEETADTVTEAVELYRRGRVLLQLETRSDAAIANAANWIASSSDGNEAFDRILIATKFLNDLHQPALVTRLLAECWRQDVQFSKRPNNDVDDLARRMVDPKEHGKLLKEGDNLLEKAADTPPFPTLPNDVVAGGLEDVNAARNLIESYRQGKPVL